MDPGVGHLRMALEENKEAVITTSLILYIGMYILLGVTGFTFPAQFAAAYAPDSYTNPDPAGNVWVTTSDVTLGVDISDPEGNNIDATFYGDGSQVGTDSISSGGRATTTWSGISDGSHSWYVQGCDTSTSDPGGDCSTSSTWNFRVDATPPSVSASHSPTSPSTSDSVTVEGTASDATSGLSEVRVYVDSTLRQTCGSSPCTYSSTYSAGSHSYEVQADDAAGNTNSDSGSFTVNDGPNAPTNPSPNNGATVSDSSPSLSADYSDPNGDSGTLRYYTGGGSSIGSCSVSSGSRCSVTWSGLSDGSHSWYAVADDGSKTAQSSTWSFTVDSGAPSVSVSHSPSTPTDSDSVTFDATASDGGTGVSEVRIYVDGSLQQTCGSSPCSYSGGPYAAGSSHSYSAEADDGAGNTNSDSGSFTVNDGPNAPTNPDPSNGALVTSGTRSISAAYSDPDGDSGTLTYRYASNDSTIGSCSVSSGSRCSVTWSGMSDGSHSWYAVAQDTHGDTATSATWSFTVDTSGPSVSASTTSPTSDRREQVDYTVSDPRFNSCSASGASVSWSCSESSTGGDTYEGSCTPQSDMQDGTYTVTVTCDDTGGNSGSDPVSLAVDTTAPTINCNNCDSPDPVRNGNTVTFAPSVGDGIAGVDTVEICGNSACTDIYCSFDADASSSCSYQTPDFAYETNPYWIRATDKVGNSRTNGPQAQDYKFTTKKWVGQSCTTDQECLIGSCTSGTCQVQRIPSPIIILR